MKQTFFWGLVWALALVPLWGNPAAGAGTQRFSLAAGGASVTGEGKSSAVWGEGVFPSRWGVFSLGAEGLFGKETWRGLRGGDVVFNGRFSKEITEKLHVGLGVFGGIALGGDGKAAFGGEAGMFYLHGNLGVFRDLGWGLAVVNAGVPFEGGPVVELGAQVRFKRLRFSLDWRGDLGNFASEAVPALKLSYAQTIRTGRVDYLHQNGWEESEISAEALWQPGKAVGGELRLELGARDEQAPVIVIREAVI